MGETLKRVSILFTDPHLHEDNIDQITDIARQVIDLAKKNEIDVVFLLGDVFKSRKSQTLVVLNAFEEILKMFDRADIVLYAFPGNHDKVNYESEKSYLSAYKHWPNFTLVSDYDRETFGDILVHCIPFFKEDTVYSEYLKKAIDNINLNKKNILLSHIALTGSVNNDGSSISNNLKASQFAKFDWVYLGHYHDQQQIASNIYHIPSVCQNNFGENNEKGFMFLLEDGTVEFVKSKFREYKKISIDLHKVKPEEVNELTAQYREESQDNNIRFEFIGSKSQLSSIDKHKFIQLGIDVKTKDIEIETDVDFDNIQLEYNKESILEAFEECCDINGWKFSEGEVYLKPILN